MSGPKEAPDNLFITDWGHPESDGWFTKAWPGKAPNEAWADYTRTDICDGLAKALKPFDEFFAALVANDGALESGGGNLVMDEINDKYLRLRDYRMVRAALARFEAKTGATE